MKMHNAALMGIAFASLFSARPALAQFSQQGPKLVSQDAFGSAEQGQSVAISADGNTAIVGGIGDNNGGGQQLGATSPGTAAHSVRGAGPAFSSPLSSPRSSANADFTGAAWIWTRNGGVWTQQAKLVGTGAAGLAGQGDSVAISADGDTAIVGGDVDNFGAGAAWVWTRSQGVWSQQGPKLVGSDAIGKAQQGVSVSLSGDGNTAIIGGDQDNLRTGAAWAWSRNDGVWTQQSMKLVGSGALGNAQQGFSVQISADGNTTIVGGPVDNGGLGAVWIWSRIGGAWAQQGPKLVGFDAIGNAEQGLSVSVSSDGNTALIGGSRDDSAGAAWVWTKTAGVWTQQGAKLVGSGAAGNADQGFSVSLSSDGNIAIVGGPGDNNDAGAVWVWKRNEGVWRQQGAKLVGTGAVGDAFEADAVSLSAEGNTAIIGGHFDNNLAGAAWIFAEGPDLIPRRRAARH